MNALIAAVAGVAAVLMMAPASGRHRLARLSARRERGPLRRSAGAVAVVVVAAGAGLGLLVASSAGASVGYCLALSGVTIVGLWRRHRRAAQASRVGEEVADACQLLAGLMRVGHVPVTALRLAAADATVLAEADAAMRVGGSVSAVLRRQGREPGGSGLTDLAISWEVAQRTGASLTATLDALAQRLQDARKLGRVVTSELAAPRATGRLLAALPGFGLILGYVVGGDPGRFLLGSLLGQACLVVGITLASVGVWWIERIASRAGG